MRPVPRVGAPIARSPLSFPVRDRAALPCRVRCNRRPALDDTTADQRRGAVCWVPQTLHGRNGFVWLLGRSLVVLMVVVNATRLELRTDASVSEDGDCTVGDHTNWRLARGRPILLRLAGSGLVTGSDPDTFPSATTSSSSDIQSAAQASRFEHFQLRFRPTGSAICGSRRPTSRTHGLFGGGKCGGPDGGRKSAAILIVGPAVGFFGMDATERRRVGRMRALLYGAALVFQGVALTQVVKLDGQTFSLFL